MNTSFIIIAQAGAEAALAPQDGGAQIAAPDGADTVPVEAFEEQQPADNPGPGPATPAPGGGMNMFVMIILMVGIFYFMLLRPQQRKEKERQKTISELRAGQRVVFAGGITGTVVEAREHTFMIEVAPGVKIEVARGAVSRTLADGENAKDA
ncbi:MAG: preprotein translocase subunit YajC [Kiritimatiellaeota bacterium]|nr:preprotein translocase subunit YajC [Kiritimatiellota bacterium]